MSVRFLEISVTSHDLVASLNFYRALGFTELTTADTWPHPYAVVTDGQVTIGLHGQAFEAPRIALSLPDLQRGLVEQLRTGTDEPVETVMRRTHVRAMR